MARKQQVDIEIDKLSNSIENAITGEVFATEFSKISSKEIKKKDWLFDWHKELKGKSNEVYKMTTVENKSIIQGLISLKKRENFVFVNLVENAKFNRGKEKIYIGVGGNLFAFSCKVSKEMGFDGFVAFDAKTALVNHYHDTLGAEKALGQRMYISNENADILINQYFTNNMKLKPEPREIDLYVSNKKMTEKELKELAEFIEQVKQKAKKHRKAA